MHKNNIITYHYNGMIDTDSWYKNKRLHSYYDLPAQIKYYEDGAILEKSWYTEGELHHDGQHPADIVYYDDGTPYLIAWYYRDIIHRFDYNPDYTPCPAYLTYDLNYNIENIEYVIFGKNVYESEYIYYIYLFRRVINKYRKKKREKLLSDIKNSRIYQKCSDDICSSIVKYIC